MLGLPTLLLRQSLRRGFSTTSGAAASSSVTSGSGFSSTTSERETENLHDQVTTRKMSPEECENLGPQQRSMFCDDKKIDPKNDFAIENDARFLENRNHEKKTIFPGSKGKTSAKTPEQEDYGKKKNLGNS